MCGGIPSSTLVTGREQLPHRPSVLEGILLAPLITERTGAAGKPLRTPVNGRTGRGQSLKHPHYWEGAITSQIFITMGDLLRDPCYWEDLNGGNLLKCSYY